MKEAVTNVIDTLTQEDFYGAFQKLLERYNKGTAAGGDYFEGNKSFMFVLSMKVPIRKKYGNLLNAPRINEMVTLKFGLLVRKLPSSIHKRAPYICSLVPNIDLFFYGRSP